MKATLLIVLLVSFAIFIEAQDFTGQATYFDPGLGACGQTNGPNDYIAALNGNQYGGGENCGRRATIWGPNGSVTVTIVDECPGCGWGDLDLSPSAFDRIANRDDGRVGIKWTFV